MRDIDEIRVTTLWLASRLSPNIWQDARIRVESIGDPACISGAYGYAPATAGDETGIVTVPRAQIAAVLATAEAIVETDRMIEAALRAGKSFSEAAAAADYI